MITIPARTRQRCIGSGADLSVATWRIAAPAICGVIPVGVASAVPRS